AKRKVRRKKRVKARKVFLLRLIHKFASQMEQLQKGSKAAKKPKEEIKKIPLSKGRIKEIKIINNAPNPEPKRLAP
ncbi:TPA: hypothetical protein DEW49_00635, partial [bacterium]|nr:hypothetical protein [bacterium]